MESRPINTTLQQTYVSNVTNLYATSTEFARENGTGTDHNHGSCAYYLEFLTFNNTQLLRVTLSWILFLISSCGNLFVLWCLRSIPKMTHVHIITLHLILADLAFTFFVIPMDAAWNVTMGWYGGLILCKMCQTLKQFGMYISSFMVMVVAFDRVFSILLPMSPIQQQKKRTTLLLATAWILSAACSLPPSFFFTLVEQVYCEGEAPFVQCVDLGPDVLKSYYIFTMFLGCIIPFIFVVISYSLVLCEITNMIKRHRVMMGRRESGSFGDIQRARKKTLILTSAVTLTFLLFWGPYYTMGLYDWLNTEAAQHLPAELSVWLFVVMYVHPAIHPFIYGFCMRSVKDKFAVTVEHIAVSIGCSRKRIKTSSTYVKSNQRGRARSAPTFSPNRYQRDDNLLPAKATSLQIPDKEELSLISPNDRESCHL